MYSVRSDQDTLNSYFKKIVDAVDYAKAQYNSTQLPQRIVDLSTGDCLIIDSFWGL
jgi:hypothetical protein